MRVVPCSVRDLEIEIGKRIAVQQARRDAGFLESVVEDADRRLSEEEYIRYAQRWRQKYPDPARKIAEVAVHVLPYWPKRPKEGAVELASKMGGIMDYVRGQRSHGAATFVSPIIGSIASVSPEEGLACLKALRDFGLGE